MQSAHPSETLQVWYEFLANEYFRWKYTAANRYATTTKQLAKYKKEGDLDARP
jgi:hypothetical protein